MHTPPFISSSEEPISSGFKVPFAVDPTGRIVAASMAIKGVAYVCPGCKGPVTFRAGDIRRKHFSHSANSNCSGETALHESVKVRIAQVIDDWRGEQGIRPTICRHCSRCKGEMEDPISMEIVRSAVEFRLPTGRILDIAALDEDGQTKLGVEVFVTNEVDEAKRHDLADLPWIEIRASDFQMDRPERWPIIQESGLPALVCDECLKQPRLRRNRTIEIAAKFGMPAPSKDYFAIEIECWRCHRETPLFFWRGIGNLEPAPAPRPGTVSRDFSHTRQEPYVMNHCVQCRAKQGDFYLFADFVAATREHSDNEWLTRIFFPYPDEEGEDLDSANP